MGSLGLIVAVLATIAVPYAQGASPCAPILPGTGPDATGSMNVQHSRSELPPASGCNAETHASFSLAMNCAFCGATLLPSKLLPPAATLELRLSSPESPGLPQSLPSLPWRPPA